MARLLRYRCIMSRSIDAAVGRLDRLDALRGLAIVWMVGFHFAFDLNHFRLVPQQDFFTDPLWTMQRACIVSLFLLCAGIGQAMATERGQGWPRFWRRWRQVAGCALLVTVGSYLMFPHSFITFGVLHGIAVMLIIARLSAGWGRWLWLAGLLAIVLPRVAATPLLEGPWLDWIGLVTRKPVTEDYVPVLPWMGVMWWGLAAGQWLRARRPGMIGGQLPAGLRPLAAVGRWPLRIYMIHQPLFIGSLMLWLKWRG
jgi:uncharacterized membrane protein